MIFNPYNQPIVDLLKEDATMKNATPAQISLTWMLHKYPGIIKNG